MEIKKRFFFDYIYYRITKFYFKWDGRNGITSIIGISMIQILIIIDVFTVIIRIFYERGDFQHIGFVKYLIVFLFGILSFYNYRKYHNKYHSLKAYWKDEPEKVKLIKGILVIVSLIAPWIPLIFIGVNFK